jgi:hypothetical protein
VVLVQDEQALERNLAGVETVATASSSSGVAWTCSGRVRSIVTLSGSSVTADSDGSPVFLVLVATGVPS